MEQIDSYNRPPVCRHHSQHPQVERPAYIKCFHYSCTRRQPPSSNYVGHASSWNLWKMTPSAIYVVCRSYLPRPTSRRLLFASPVHPRPELPPPGTPNSFYCPFPLLPPSFRSLTNCRPPDPPASTGRSPTPQPNLAPLLRIYMSDGLHRSTHCVVMSLRRVAAATLSHSPTTSRLTRSTPSAYCHYDPTCHCPTHICSHTTRTLTTQIV